MTKCFQIRQETEEKISFVLEKVSCGCHERADIC